MTVIQVLLISAICLLFIFYFKILKHQAITRLLFAALFALGLMFVLFPELTHKIANALGIGRGADLLLYFGIIGGFLVFLWIYSRFRELERQLAELVRKQAILHARKSASAEDKTERIP